MSAGGAAAGEAVSSYLTRAAAAAAAAAAAVFSQQSSVSSQFTASLRSMHRFCGFRPHLPIACLSADRAGRVFHVVFTKFHSLLTPDGPSEDRGFKH